MFLAVIAFNDAALAKGGSPRLMHGQSSVRMVSERILVQVGAEKTTATCRFTFQNDGPVATIKMGFPDDGFGAADPEEEMDPKIRAKPPKTGPMTSFRSWVAGKAVATRLERGEEAGEYWHTKTVNFPANFRIVVTDMYTLRESGAIVDMKGRSTSASYAGYVVRTGASWKGTIGRSEVVFELPNQVSSAISAAKVSQQERMFTVASFPKGAVVYSGMATPAVSGRRLTFIRTNWHPRAKDDIGLWFDFKKPS